MDDQTPAPTPPALPPKQVTVNGQTATEVHFLGADGKPDGTLGVFVPTGDGQSLTIQIPPTLHWTPTQITTFANAIHTTTSAETTVG